MAKLSHGDMHKCHLGLSWSHYGPMELVRCARPHLCNALGGSHLESRRFIAPKSHCMVHRRLPHKGLLCVYVIRTIVFQP